MDESRFPAKPGTSREDNIRSAATSLVVDYPVLLRETAEAAVRQCLEAPDDAWVSWETRRPDKYDAPIIAHDHLGYVHIATHLIGAKEPGWIDRWMRVRI